jgi:ZIP family zinc transporter
MDLITASQGRTHVLLLVIGVNVALFVGGLLAEFRDAGFRPLRFALLASSGLLIAVVATELIPRAREGLDMWSLTSALAGGSGIYLVIFALGRWRRQQQAEQITGNRDDVKGNRSSHYVATTSAAARQLSFGFVIGSVAPVSWALASFLAVVLAFANLPEGYRITAESRENGLSRMSRIAYLLALTLPAILGALVAYILLRNTVSIFAPAILAMNAGLLLAMAVRTISADSHDAIRNGTAALIAVISGFIGACFLIAGLEAAFDSTEADIRLRQHVVGPASNDAKRASRGEE